MVEEKDTEHYYILNLPEDEIVVLSDYWICPKCGAYLDYGEACDCHKERKRYLNVNNKNNNGRYTKVCR